MRHRRTGTHEDANPGPGTDAQLAGTAQRQRRVASALRAGGPRMPVELHARIDALGARRATVTRSLAHRSRPLVIAAVAIAGAALVVAGALAVARVDRGHGETSLAASRIASDVWRVTPQAVSPEVDRRDPARLALAFHGTWFPNYHDGEGWHASGVGTQTVAGHRALTVYYRTGARRATYTVVAGTAVAVPDGAARFAIGTRRLAEYRQRTIWVIAFHDHGNTCVLAAAAPRERRWLVGLAEWRAGA